MPITQRDKKLMMKMVNLFKDEDVSAGDAIRAMLCLIESILNFDTKMRKKKNGGSRSRR
jgi:hypothetical protein